MVSILIPVYNYCITGLAEELIRQGSTLDHPYEIIFLDDASLDRKVSLSNQDFCEKKKISYFISDENKGRAAARNWLAEKAQYPWLLFLDSDVFPAGQDFLKNYIASVSETSMVCSGSIVYRRDIPEEKQNLRWKYGVKYEEVSRKEKNAGKYLHVKSANLFVKKEIFTRFRFPVLKYNYGFEDTLFGLMLQQEKINLELIDNPVYHDGLETNPEFLHKTEEGIKNLVFLIKENNPLCEYINIVKVYKKMKGWKLENGIRVLFNVSKKRIYRNLLSGNPSVFLFQCYKLGYLLELLAKEKSCNKALS